MDHSDSALAQPAKATDSPPGIGRQMAKGAAWMVFMQVTIRIIGLVSMVILARLLVPEDFGLIALAMMVYGLLEVFGQFGFDVVLIQNQQADRRHYDTAWTLTVIRNTVIAALLLVSAPLAASFFNEPRLQAILYWLAAAAFIEGFANIGVVNFRKDLEFHKDFVFMVGTKLGAFAVSIPLAFVWRSYWALVAGIVAAALIRVVLGYFMNDYRPRPNLAACREIMNFSKWLVLNNLAQFIFTRADTFIIGKIAGTPALGIFSIASEISNLPNSELLAPIRRALFPGYAKLRSQPAVLREDFLHTLATIVAIAIPMAAGIGLIADPMVRVTLGDKWIDAIPIVHILAIYAVLNVCSANIWPMYLALGKPELFARVMGISAIIVVPLLFVGTSLFGIFGAAWALTAAVFFQVTINIRLSSRLLNISFLTILRATWRSFVAAFTMASSVVGLQYYWPPTYAFGENFLLLIVCVISGAMVYIYSHWVFWRLCGSPDGVETIAIGQLCLLGRNLKRCRIA